MKSEESSRVSRDGWCIYHARDVKNVPIFYILNQLHLNALCSVRKWSSHKWQTQDQDSISAWFKYWFRLLMAQLIIHAAPCVTHQNNTFFSFPHDTKFPSPTDLASSPAAGISPGSLARQWRTITPSKKPCGNDKCSFYWAGDIMFLHQS